MKKTFFILKLIIVVIVMNSLAFAETIEELVVVGTGSGTPVLEAVAKKFIEQYRNVVIEIPASIGSGGGIRAVGEDEYIIGRVARDIQEREERYGLTQTPIARVPIVFYVNTNVSISEITPEQAGGIFAGTIRNWKEIGGGEGKIRVIRREDGDSSLMILLKLLPGFNNITLTPRSKTTYTDHDTVKECMNQSNTIAFGSYADVKKANGVRSLGINGVYATDPQYPYVGVLSLVYKQKNYKGTVRKFVDFFSSDSAKTAIIDAGGLPVE